MGTIFNENYNIDIYEVWDNKIKWYHVGITKFNDDEKVLGVNWVYIQSKNRYELEKLLQNDIELVSQLYNTPENFKLYI